jgi:hypothetical protein
MKKRERDDMDTPNSSVGNGTPAANPNRPKAGRKPPAVSSSNTGGGSKASNPNSVENQKVYTSTLEARLNNLEALLRSIPPGVHNALINQLDGQLSAGTQPGQSNSASVDVQGVSGAIDGLSATDFAHLLRQHGTTLPGNPGLQIGAVSAQGSRPINPEQVNQLGRNASGISLANLGLPQSTFGIDMSAGSSNSAYQPNVQSTGSFNGLNANALRNGNVGLGSYSIGMMQDNIPSSSASENYSANPIAGLTFGDFDLNQPTLEDFTADPDDSILDALNDVERGMEGLNLSNGYLYVDEIGQTKWQGEQEPERKNCNAPGCSSLTRVWSRCRCNFRVPSS